MKFIYHQPIRAIGAVSDGTACYIESLLIKTGASHNTSLNKANKSKVYFKNDCTTFKL